MVQCPVAVHPSLVLAKGRRIDLRRELSKFVPDHVLRHRELVINFPIMHLKLQADEVRQDGCGARLSFYRNKLLAYLRPYDWKAGGRIVLVERVVMKDGAPTGRYWDLNVVLLRCPWIGRVGKGTFPNRACEEASRWEHFDVLPVRGCWPPFGRLFQSR